MGLSLVGGLAGSDGMAGGTYLGLSPGRGHHREQAAVGRTAGWKRSGCARTVHRGELCDQTRVTVPVCLRVLGPPLLRPEEAQPH